ncbi:ribonuclease VapC [uncultured Methanobacterium sp.]|uniref:ribonuclease VapC n=1 Tax=uncultured Methanobacterium sp. TaxID=176306 RepID=UPI002AA832A6|nr:ribonuclease VapC [uncultured Methanobacterium sp.]
MKEKVYVLDASGIIGGFVSSKYKNITTNTVVSEIKDLKSKITLQSALDHGKIIIEEPDSSALKEVQRAIENSGDVLRLSEVDITVVALAVTLKKNYSPTVVTDDYSIQNILKIQGIPYRSVLTEGIKEVYGWIKICRGCRKKYPSNYEGDDCEICGSAVYRKRIKK